MESKPKRVKRSYDRHFILTALLEYYSQGVSKNFITRKYSLSRSLFYSWIRRYESETLSLPSELSELESKVYMSYRKNKPKAPPVAEPQTEEERLRDEVLRLRKALAYSELRNEALHEVISICKDKYGIDLLKKAGARQ